MKKGTLLIITILLGLSCSAVQYDKSKTIERTFSLSTRPTLVIDASYSDMVITHSNRSDIVVKIVVTTTAKTEMLATQMLDVAKYKFTESGTSLKLEATIDSDLNKKINGRNSSSSIKITYYISLPMESTLEFDTRYGDITIDQVNRPLTANLAYGSLKINGPVAAQSDLRVIYGNVNIAKSTDKMDIDIQYGNVNIANSTAEMDIDMQYGNIDIATSSAELNIDLQYGNVNLGKVADLDIDIAYGKVDISSARSLDASSAYSDWKLGVIETLTVSKSAYDNWQYGDVKVRK